MTETPARRPRPRRTFSTFGEVRRMPSEYEIVTHAQNWTLRQNRAATFEQNPSSAPNLWFLTYRENSPLKAENWDAYRDPDALTYKAYVNLQAEAEAKVHGVLEAHAEAGPDLDAGSVALLGHLFTPSRYLCHGFQQVEAYIGYMAPSSYITNAAGFSTADFLRRVTTIAYRTRELQIASPDSGIGSAERSLWEEHDGWQPGRHGSGADRRHHHDPHFRGMPAYRGHGRSDPRRTHPAQRHRRVPCRLAVDTGLAARRHHGQRARAVARHRLHPLAAALGAR